MSQTKRDGKKDLEFIAPAIQVLLFVRQILSRDCQHKMPNLLFNYPLKEPNITANVRKVEFYFLFKIDNLIICFIIKIFNLVYFHAEFAIFMYYSIFIQNKLLCLQSR